MRLIYALLLGCSILTEPAYADSLKTLPAGYQIVFNKDGTLTAKSATKEIRGHLVKRLNIFSQWRFGESKREGLDFIADPDTFGVIVNEKTQTVMRINDEVDGPESGPDLQSVSPYPHNYVVFDSSRGLGDDDLEIRTTAGKLVFENYMGELTWVNNHYIKYSQLDENKKPTATEVKECRDTTEGDSLIKYWVGYDLKTKQKKMLNIPIEKLCSQ